MRRTAEVYDIVIPMVRSKRSTTATVHKTSTLTHQQDDWIKAQVEGGHYTNDSEYIRDLIRREQERAAEIDVVRAALPEGEKSGQANALRCGCLEAQGPPHACLKLGSPPPRSVTSKAWIQRLPNESTPWPICEPSRPEAQRPADAQMNRAGYQWPCARDKNLPSSTPTSSSISAFNFSFSPMNNSAFAFPSSAKLRVSCGSSWRS